MIMSFIVLFSIIHSSLLNHWMPVSVLVRSYQIPFRRSLLIFAGTALAHNTSTIIFAYLAARLGVFTQEKVEHFTVYASSILILIGLYYLFTYKKGHHHHHHHDPIAEGIGKSFWIIYLGILVNMFFSPCIDVTFTFFAISSNLTASTVLLYCLTYFVISVGGMVFFMGLSHKGLALVSFQKVEKYSRLVFGLLFILLGIFSIYGDNYLDHFIDTIGLKNPLGGD